MISWKVAFPFLCDWLLLPLPPPPLYTTTTTTTNNTDPLCKICGQFQETIDYIATGCPELAKTECLHNSGSDKSPGTNVERAGEIYTANPG